MTWCLTAPSQYLSQCWSAIIEVLWYSLEGNFTGSAQATVAQATVLYIEIDIFALKLSRSNLKLSRGIFQELCSYFKLVEFCCILVLLTSVHTLQDYVWRKMRVFFIANWFWACFNIISANEKCCFLYKSFSHWPRLSCHKKGRCWSVFSINLIYQIPNSITFPTNDDLCSYINTYIMTSLIFSRCLMQVSFHKFIFAVMPVIEKYS